jgi:hypothetical protein
MTNTIFVGIFTNFLTIILGALAGAVALVFRRKRILRFYGIRRPQDTVRIIISRLDVQAGGTAAAIAITKGYVGPAVTQPEYEAAVLLQEQIRPNIFAWLSSEVRDWISGKLVLTAAVNPIIELAPAPDDAPSWLQSHSRTNLILMGGPTYNAATRYYQEYEGAHFALLREAAGGSWHARSLRGRTPRDPGIIESRSVGQELAFIQRIIRKDTGANITMCSGTGAGATFAGVEWLSRNYRQLDRRCRDGEYGILLAFAGVTDPQSRFPRENSMIVRDRVFDGKRDC